jgi:hypothetical protein
MRGLNLKKMLSFWNLEKKDAFFQKLGFGPLKKF